MVRGIDHIAFAMEKHSASSSIAWYEKVFGMKRFIVNQ
jgi:4-hydroxyphenylpyruvate dioxygenase-like putative hemolysin